MYKKGYAHISKLAVWENDNEYVSYIPSADPTNTGGGGVGKGVQVRTISLDTILKPIEKVKLLKIDAEGSEYQILLSTKNIQKIEYICGEYHGGITVYKALEYYFQQNGFDCIFRASESDQWLGLFFAKRKDLADPFFKNISFDKCEII